MEKIKTQDSVDENGRKNTYHGNTRAGACLEHRENGSEPNLKKSNTGGRQEQLLQRDNDVSTLPAPLLFSFGIFGPNQRQHEDLRIKVFNNSPEYESFIFSASVLPLPKLSL